MSRKPTIAYAFAGALLLFALALGESPPAADPVAVAVYATALPAAADGTVMPPESAGEASVVPLAPEPADAVGLETAEGTEDTEHLGFPEGGAIGWAVALPVTLDVAPGTAEPVEDPAPQFELPEDQIRQPENQESGGGHGTMSNDD